MTQKENSDGFRTAGPKHSSNAWLCQKCTKDRSTEWWNCPSRSECHICATPRKNGCKLFGGGVYNGRPAAKAGAKPQPTATERALQKKLDELQKRLDEKDEANSMEVDDANVEPPAKTTATIQAELATYEADVKMVQNQLKTRPECPRLTAWLEGVKRQTAEK